MTAQPFENAAQQPDTTQPVPECPPASIAPQNGTQGRDAKLAAAYRLGHEHGSMYATDRYADGYAAACRFYGDTAPLAVSSARELVAQFRDQWDKAGQLTGTPVGQFLADLQDILDTAQEPK